MLVHVKKPLIDISGDIGNDLLDILKKKYGKKNISIDTEDSIPVEHFQEFSNHKKKMTPGDSLKAIRELHGCTQKDLSVKLGLQVHIISGIENGHRKIEKETAKKLAKIFNVPLIRFL